MTGRIQKRLSQLLLQPLKGRRSSKNKRESMASRSITIMCTPDHNTTDILAQLQEVSLDNSISTLVLQEMIQRPDNVQLFSKIQDLLRSSSTVHAIHLLEPHIHCADYRRWLYKKSNFLNRVRKDAKERGIHIIIHGTLILDERSSRHYQEDIGEKTFAQPQQQDVSNYLSLLQQILHDPDITSLWISLREEAPPAQLMLNSSITSLNSSFNSSITSFTSSIKPRRRSQLDLQQSPVQQVFQALVELFNSDSRQWHFVNCHVEYHPSSIMNDESIHEEQTQALLDVAELFAIPLQVQWQPVPSPGADDQSTAVGWTRTTSTAEQRFPAASSAARAAVSATRKHGEDDLTSVTFGSSGAF